MAVVFATRARASFGWRLLAGASGLLWSCGYDWDSFDPRLGTDVLVGAGRGGEAPTAAAAGAAGVGQPSGAGTAGAVAGAGATATAGSGPGGRPGDGGAPQPGVGGEAGGTLQLGGAGAGQVAAAGESGSGGETGLAGEAGSVPQGGSAAEAGSVPQGGSAAEAGSVPQAGSGAETGFAGEAGSVPQAGSAAETGAAGQTGGGFAGGTGTGGAPSGGTAGTAGGSESQAGWGGVGGDGGVCPAGQQLCGDVCVSTQTNTDHCGQCDNPCSDSEICRDGNCTVPCSAEGLSALFVVRTDPVSEGDPDAYALLTTLGFSNITLVTTEGLGFNEMIPAGLEAGMDLVVVSSTPMSIAIGDRFTGSVVPVITWEHRLFDDLGMSLAGGVAENSTSIEVVDPLHPLAAGLSGVTTVFNSPGRVGWGQATASAAVVATSATNPAQAVLFAVEAGAPLQSGTAASRRVGLFLDNLGARLLTPAGRRLSLVALCWAAGLPPY